MTGRDVLAEVEALRKRQAELTRLIREARGAVAAWDVTPSGPSLEQTAAREQLRTQAFGLLRRIIAVEDGAVDPE